MPFFITELVLFLLFLIVGVFWVTRVRRTTKFEQPESTETQIGQLNRLDVARQQAKERFEELQLKASQCASKIASLQRQIHLYRLEEQKQEQLAKHFGVANQRNELKTALVSRNRARISAQKLTELLDYFGNVSKALQEEIAKQEVGINELDASIEYLEATLSYTNIVNTLTPPDVALSVFEKNSIVTDAELEKYLL